MTDYVVLCAFGTCKKAFQHNKGRYIYRPHCYGKYKYNYKRRYEKKYRLYVTFHHKLYRKYTDKHCPTQRLAYSGTFPSEAG